MDERGPTRLHIQLQRCVLTQHNQRYILLYSCCLKLKGTFNEITPFIPLPVFSTVATGQERSLISSDGRGLVPFHCNTLSQRASSGFRRSIVSTRRASPGHSFYTTRETCL